MAYFFGSLARIKIHVDDEPGGPGKYPNELGRIGDVDDVSATQPVDVFFDSIAGPQSGHCFTVTVRLTLFRLPTRRESCGVENFARRAVDLSGILVVFRCEGTTPSSISGESENRNLVIRPSPAKHSGLRDGQLVAFERRARTR